MKRDHLKRGGCLLLCTVMILGVSLLIGCGSGDTGATGAQGATGPAGPAGPAGTSTTAESCAVCHGTGMVADIAVKHPDDPAFTGAQVTISNVIVTNNAGILDVSLHLEWSADNTPVTGLTENGTPVAITVDNFRFYAATLVPAGTPTDPTGHDWGTWDTDYWERWVQERTPGSTGYPQGTLDDSDAANGNYTYTFATQLGSAEALLDAPDYDESQAQRIMIRFDGRDDDNITQRTTAFADFTTPQGGGPVTALDPQRQFVTAEACEKCHSPNWERAAHASGYRDIRACVMCHSPLGFDHLETDPVDANRGQFMQDNDTYASVFFHKIHAAIDIPHWSNRIDGRGYGAVTFPQVDANEELRNCVICHVDLTNDGAGGGLGTQTFQIDKWKTHPTAEICTSCHTDVDPINNTGTVPHEGGQQTNADCHVCHQSSGLSTSVVAPIPAAHDITPRVAGTNGTRDDGYLPENIPEFDVTLTITDPAAGPGTYYDVGEEPEVRVTLKHHATGLPVDPAVYTANQDTPGVTGGGLSEAYLQVYGPRAMAVPVLATDSTTDPNWIKAGSVPGDIEDEHEMFFVGGTDPRVTTDATGFGYRLLAIPADMKPGTYMLRVAVADYGRVGSGNYHIDSTAFMNIQIGTATVEPKVAGDACINCHGLGTAPFHDERHSVFFDTDQCLACHHDTGHDIGERVHGVPLANRVHAVHSANREGDIYAYSLNNDTVGTGRDWSDVTFPREIQNCNTCHNSQYDVATNTFMGTYKTYPYMMPCSGCHVGASNDIQGDLPFIPNVVDHMRQNGGPW